MTVGPKGSLRDVGQVVIAVLCALWIYSYFAVSIPWATARHGLDFGMLQRAACTGDLYADDPLSPELFTSGQRYLNLNPPQLHLALWPFCNVSTATGYHIWVGASLLIIWLGLRVAACPTALRSPATHAAIVMSAPTSTLVATGQVTAVVLPLVLLAWALDRQRRSIGSGIALGVAVSLKPFLGLVALWWLQRGNWKGMLALCASAIASYACGAAVYGTPALGDYIDNLRAVSWVAAPLNASIWAPWARAFGAAPGNQPIAANESLWFGATVISLAVVLAMTTLSLRRDRSIDYGWAMCLTAALLLSPLGWAYYGFLAVPILLRLPLTAKVWTMAALLAAVLPGTVTQASRSPWGAFTLGSAYTWSLCVVWVGLVRLAVVPKRIEPSAGVDSPLELGARRT